VTYSSAWVVLGKLYKKPPFNPTLEKLYPTPPNIDEENEDLIHAKK